MKNKKPAWKKGRGKLGVMQPLLGKWVAKSDSPMGNVTVTREFIRALDDQCILLDVTWQFAKSTYTEHAVYGHHEGELRFWSFTSDGKRSEGRLSDGTDVHPESICFEVKVPAGIARMIYWPHEDGTVHVAVEAKNKKGWKRFVEHSCTQV